MDKLNKIIQVFKIRDLRKKILFVLGVFAIFRLMANIPIPGINIENLKSFFDQFQVFGLLNVFTGGALDNLSIMMLGLGPYITGVIIMQLLTMIFPQLERLYKEEGESGLQKFNHTSLFVVLQLFLSEFMWRPRADSNRPSSIYALRFRRSPRYVANWNPGPDSNWHDPFTVFRLGNGADTGT